MNRVNFDKLKSIKTPDEWLEKVVNIPKKQKAIPFYRHTSFLASAACIALSIISGIIILFADVPDKSPVSNKMLSETVRTADESIPITTPNSTIKSNISQNSSDSKNLTSDNKSEEQITQTVTEPSENNSKNQSSDFSDGSNTATGNSSRVNDSLILNGGGNANSNEINDETRTPCSATENPTSNIRPDTRPIYTKPSEILPCEEYDNPIYLHLKGDSTFVYSDIVGCHIKEIGGENLYPLNSDYERCDVTGGSSGWEYVEDICIIYHNNGPKAIEFGLYEITFYDVKGNKITRTANFLDNNSAYIFYE